ncbi:MAG TPA: hypothetical protein PLV88_01845, partial [Methanoregulaceae archaeon]|nr:hypothetical protein [Methanoregulaceae archaeon]
LFAHPAICSRMPNTDGVGCGGTGGVGEGAGLGDGLGFGVGAGDGLPGTVIVHVSTSESSALNTNSV